MQTCFKRKNLIKQIKRKLNYNNATVIKADGGNSVIITCCEEYKKKINEFITSQLNTDPTNTYKQTLTTVNL